MYFIISVLLWMEARKDLQDHRGFLSTSSVLGLRKASVEKSIMQPLFLGIPTFQIIQHPFREAFPSLYAVFKHEALWLLLLNASLDVSFPPPPQFSPLYLLP